MTPHYDPMLAKLVVHGRDRAEALARARAALAATRVVGVAHNLGFLEALLAQRDGQLADSSNTLTGLKSQTQLLALQVQQLRKPNEAGWMPERAALVEELTSFVLRGCGIKR